MTAQHTNGTRKNGHDHRHANPTHLAGNGEYRKENQVLDEAGTAHFSFEGAVIRMVVILGVPWFLAADVCRALQLAVSKGVGPALRILDDDEKRQVDRAKFFSNHPVNFEGWDVEGDSPTVWLITESALYLLAMRSQGAIKKGTVAHRFRGWVTREVLPVIRATGSYNQSSIAGDTVTLSLTEPARYVVMVTPNEPPHILKTAYDKMPDEWSGLDTEILANHMRTVDALWQKTQLVRSVGDDPAGSLLYKRLGKAISDGRRIADECLDSFRQQPD